MHSLSLLSVKHWLFISLLALLLSACTNNGAPHRDLVADAYDTSGLLQMPAYKRTIFSSTDF